MKRISMRCIALAFLMTSSWPLPAQGQVHVTLDGAKVLLPCTCETDPLRASTEDRIEDLRRVRSCGISARQALSSPAAKFQILPEGKIPKQEADERLATNSDLRSLKNWCEDERDRIESKLVKRLKFLDNELGFKIIDLAEALKATPPPDDPANGGEPDGVIKVRLEINSDKLEEYKKERDEILDAVKINPSDEIILDFRNYSPWIAIFSLGGEYISVDEVFGKSYALSRLQIYRQFFNDPAKWKRIHGYIDVKYSSSAEFSILDQSGLGGDDEMTTTGQGSSPTPAMTDPAEMNEGATDSTGPEPQPTVSSTIGVFYPLYRFGSVVGGEEPTREVFGLLGEYAFNSIDEVNQFRQRWYGGFRFAFNPEFHFDVLYGKSEGTTGHRLEVRGQFPVMKFAAARNSRIYMGAIANFSTEGKAFKVQEVPEDDPMTPDVNEHDAFKPEEAADSLRIFISWNVDLKRLLTRN